MKPSERVEVFTPAARIVEWPYMCKGNSDGRRMTLELVNDGGDRMEVLIPAPMNCFSSLTGYWLSTYNLETNVKGKIVDPKTRSKSTPRQIPGKKRARKGMLQQLLYQRTQDKPREFRCYKNSDGQLVLFADKPYRMPK